MSYKRCNVAGVHFHILELDGEPQPTLIFTFTLLSFLAMKEGPDSTDIHINTLSVFRDLFHIQFSACTKCVSVEFHLFPCVLRER
jgi:hypothetical protein